ncbi:lipoprotein putative [Algibacter lectus]|uniref:Lipoprotein putative n=1 Tax=Algibacter lectus TaxID=221126 RepID=A0A090X5A0_9FLAO|nr:lipoprotein putative [Algibacter lectus]
MKFVKTLAILFLVASCAPIYVNYDYEKGTDFTKYKSYNYYADMKTGLSELDTKRLLNALDEQLQAKGFALSDTPDFL